MTRQQINVKLPPDLIEAAKRKGSLTRVVEKALELHLYADQMHDMAAELIEDHERRISRLEEMAGL